MLKTPDDNSLYYLFAGLGVVGGFVLPRIAYKLFRATSDVRAILPGLLDIIQTFCVYLTFLACVRVIRMWGHYLHSHSIPLDLTNALNAGSDVVLYVLIGLIAWEYAKLEWGTKLTSATERLRSRLRSTFGRSRHS